MNIYTPLDHLTKAQTLIPVMVWIHGGGFMSGSNALPLYDGTNFVARSIQLGRPIILVSINYRLNYLGFMSSRELVQDVHSSPGGARTAVGNWGLLDQRMALEWVRDHIHNFGGNAADVTAFGESAGATSIGYHLLIPGHHGLFQRAIMQSGTPTTMAAGRAEIEGQRYFDHLCRHFQLDDDHIKKTSSEEKTLTAEEKMRRLRAIPATELVKAGDKGRVGMFTPTIDNVLISADVRDTIHDPTQYDPGLKAVMLGDCRDEGQAFMPTIGARSMRRWDKFVARYCPPTDEDRKEFEAMYGVAKTDKEARRISAQVLTDAVFAYPTYAASVTLMKTLQLHSPQHQQHELEMVRFHFDRPLQLLDDMGLRTLGAYHGSELPYVFGSDASRLILSENEKALSQQMMDIWILFAWGETSRRYGLRHGLQSLLPKHALSQEAILFTETCAVERGLTERMDHQKVAFWQRYEQWVRQRRARQYTALAKQAQNKL
jgi:para-nitrobenzyl esterase